MKPQTVKPSEQPMRYFTADLYVRFNSSDDDVADVADEAWEAAVVGYREHLDAIRDRMPSQVRKLSAFDLHDAELLAFDQVAASAENLLPAEPATAILSLKQDGTIISLVYHLSGRVEEQSPPSDEWPFSKQRVHWLYDEIDLDASHGAGFLHRILLSDGRTLEIPFNSVVSHRVALPQVCESDTPRQSA
jgi:hypothetical protein